MEKRFIVNLGELAEVPGLPNEHGLRKLIRDHADFPVIDRGAKGSEYQFDLAEVLPWWRQHKAAQVEADRARTENNRQQSLMDLGSDALSLGGAPRSKADMELELLSIKMGELRGALIRRDSLKAATAEVAVIDARMRGGFAQRLVENVPLSPTLRAAIDTLQEFDRKAFAADLAQVVDAVAGEQAASMGGDDG